MYDKINNNKNNPIASELYKFDIVEFVQSISDGNLLEYQKDILIKIIDNLSKGKQVMITPYGRGGIPSYIIFDK